MEKILEKTASPDVRVFVIWEKVLASDWVGVRTPALSRIPDPRAAQFWDRDRLLSNRLGEQQTGEIVWDWIALYGRGARWGAKPAYEGRPVVDVAGDFERALRAALQ